ncbi:MAG: phosphoenolpyruvate--protein phosphotransferase [Actinomycetota bacterium]
MAEQIELRGIGAATGAAVGRAVLLADRTDVVVPDVEEPAEAFRAAASVVAGDLSDLADQAGERGRDEAASVLQAQSLMAEDPMLASSVEVKLGEGQSFHTAIAEAGTELRTMLESLDDPYLAARAADVAEVVERISCHLAGVPLRQLESGGEPVIYLATTLTAAETAQMDPNAVLGFVTETGGPTSHVVIIARSMGVPAVVATGDGSMSRAGLSDGDLAALDGGTGEVVLRPNEDVRAEYGVRVERHRAAVEAAEAWRGQPVRFGERAVTVAANVANQADLDQAIEAKADGIGLLRTEFLFLDRPAPPSEDEQYQFYAAAAQGFDQPVVIRTFDIGGDKPADYLTITDEENPFLGVRGARLYRHHPEVFETQVRAVLRAAVHGDVWMMIPMVTTIEEILDLRTWIDRIAADAANGDHEVRMPKLGVMVEVPALALNADAVVDRVDFVSIGSNDLTQYTLAADRTNEALGHLQDALDPSVLRLCELVAAAARRADISVSVCGLSAADPSAAAAYAALGIDKLSVSGRMVNPTKAVVAALEHEPGRTAVEEALVSGSAAAARARLDRWRSATTS